MSAQWQDHEVERCLYERLLDTEVVEASRESKIDEPETHHGQGDEWWIVEGKGFAGIWRPPNYSNRARFGPCYVHPEHRGEGVGKALVMARFVYAKHQPDVQSMDTYAHNPPLWIGLGFEPRESYDFGTTHLVRDEA